MSDTERFLGRREVLRRLGVSQTTLYRWLDAGAFPRPVPMGPRRVGWLESELQAWIAERVANRDATAA